MTQSTLEQQNHVTDQQLHCGRTRTTAATTPSDDTLTLNPEACFDSRKRDAAFAIGSVEDVFSQGSDALTVNGQPTLQHIDFTVLDSFRFPDRQGFPDSYRAFIRHAGWARTFGLWLIYPPVLPGFADGWQGRARNLTAHLHSAYKDGRNDEFDWMVEPDGDWSLSDSLQVFGWSENGDTLLWETASRGADGEFPVWESRSLNSLHRLGESFCEALPSIRSRTVSLFGPRTYDIEPLQPVQL